MPALDCLTRENGRLAFFHGAHVPHSMGIIGAAQDKSAHDTFNLDLLVQECVSSSRTTAAWAGAARTNKYCMLIGRRRSCRSLFPLLHAFRLAHALKMQTKQLTLWHAFRSMHESAHTLWQSYCSAWNGGALPKLSIWKKKKPAGSRLECYGISRYVERFRLKWIWLPSPSINTLPPFDDLHIFASAWTVSRLCMLQNASASRGVQCIYLWCDIKVFRENVMASLGSLTSEINNIEVVWYFDGFRWIVRHSLQFSRFVFLSSIFYQRQFASYSACLLSSRLYSVLIGAFLCSFLVGGAEFNNEENSTSKIIVATVWPEQFRITNTRRDGTNVVISNTIANQPAINP